MSLALPVFQAVRYRRNGRSGSASGAHYEDCSPLFELLIKAVEESVRAWDYDRVKTEVHVDVRFYVE